MNRMVFLTALGVFATVSVGALAQEAATPVTATPDAAGQQAAANETPAPVAATQEKKVCRTEKATGSLTRRNRICMTAVQWRELNMRTRTGVDEMTRNANGAPSCSPPEVCH
ncbi:MAG: hypothetical protein ABIT16_04115 [Croceibacterium sp.]